MLQAVVKCRFTNGAIAQKHWEMFEFSQKANGDHSAIPNLPSDLAMIHESNNDFVSFAVSFFQTEIRILPDRIFSIRGRVSEERERAELIENMQIQTVRKRENQNQRKSGLSAKCFKLSQASRSNSPDPHISTKKK